MTLLHGSLCRNFYFSQLALLLAQLASSVDRLEDSATGSLFLARRALLPFIARHRLLWHCYPHRGHAFARPESVTDQPRVDPHRGRSYCHPSAHAPSAAVSYGGVGSRTNGCTPRAWARGRGTHSGCTRRARWASLYTSCERDGSAKSRPPSRPIVLPSAGRLHRQLP